jgi:hypothetical protein
MTKPLSPEPTISTRIARGYVDLQLVLQKEGLKNDVKGYYMCVFLVELHKTCESGFGGRTASSGSTCKYGTVYMNGEARATPPANAVEPMDNKARW